MRILLVALCMLAAALPATVQADQFAEHIQVVERAGETSVVQTETSRAIVFFEERDNLYHLTMLLSPVQGGEVLRAGFQLADGQGHAMVVYSEDGSARDRFTLQRSGSQILVTATPMTERRAEL